MKKNNKNTLSRKDRKLLQEYHGISSDMIDKLLEPPVYTYPIYQSAEDFIEIKTKPSTSQHSDFKTEIDSSISANKKVPPEGDA